MLPIRNALLAGGAQFSWSAVIWGPGWIALRPIASRRAFVVAVALTRRSRRWTGDEGAAGSKACRPRHGHEVSSLHKVHEGVPMAEPAESGRPSQRPSGGRSATVRDSFRRWQRYSTRTTSSRLNARVTVTGHPSTSRWPSSSKAIERSQPFGGATDRHCGSLD